MRLYSPYLHILSCVGEMLLATPAISKIQTILNPLLKAQF